MSAAVYFVLADFAVGVLELDFAVFGGFDFGAAQDQSGFDTVRERVVVAGGAVVAEDFDFFFHGWTETAS